MTDLLTCRHPVYDREIEAEDGFIWVRWKCVEGDYTEWVRIGEIPDKTRVPMLEYRS